MTQRDVHRAEEPVRLDKLPGNVVVDLRGLRDSTQRKIAREREVAERSRTIEELQGRVSALERDVRSLNGALSAQERIIAYREGIRWWIKLPWVRARRWIDRW